MYSQPPAVALDFVLSRKLYIQPPASALDFDLATDSAIVYSMVPGVIKDVGTPWRPQPGQKQSTLAALFQQADQMGIQRAGNASQASTILDDRITAGHQEASPISQAHGIAWDPVAGKERRVTAIYKLAPAKDIIGKASPWALTSQHLDPKLGAPFLVKTPWKDRALQEKFFSSDLYGPLWRREENTPWPIGKVVQGQSDFDFRIPRKVRDSAIFELVPVFENNPIQPKDPAWGMQHMDAPAADIAKAVPWGPGGARDNTLDVPAGGYTGPVGEGENLFIIPTLRFYVVANSAQIVRVSDGRDVPASSISLSIGSDSFTWSFSAVLAGASALALVEGTDGEPVEVDVTINGITWRILIDGWDLTEARARKGGVVQGRSLAAYLAAPYAPTRDYSEGSGLLAQQLASQELPAGWNLDWNMVNWFVPPGAWQYQGLSPIEAIAKIAAAGGGYVQTHTADQTILVNQLYPEAPWNLHTVFPDFQIPRDVLVQRSSRKVPGQRVNGVYVMGAAVSPVHAQVVRRQSNGIPGGPTIVDPLITDVTAAEARGIAAIASSLRQARETHELPLSAALGGLIEVGSLVEIGEEIESVFVGGWRGLVRGVSVTAAAVRAGNGGITLKVRQNLEIERHFDEGDL